jgi:hypothetical protein
MSESTKKNESQLGSGVLHPSARPMKVYVDDYGVMYLCDRDIDPTKPLKNQACWTCDQVLFNRGG